MHRVFRPAVGVLASVALCAFGCSSLQVGYDYDPSVDFSRYRTWYWLPPTSDGDPRTSNDLLNARIRNAVEEALAAKGYRRAPTGEGDFGVGYHTAIEGKLDVRTIDTYYGYGPGWGHYGGLGGMGTETYVDQYDQGTLLLDVVDARTHRLAWRGSASARVVEGLQPEERAARIRKAVDEMLAKFPPPATP